MKNTRSQARQVFLIYDASHVERVSTIFDLATTLYKLVKVLYDETHVLANARLLFGDFINISSIYR